MNSMRKNYIYYSHLSIVRAVIAQLVQRLGYGLDDRGSRFRFLAGAGNFSLHHSVQNGSGAHPASYPTGTGDPSLGREADHSSPSSAEVRRAAPPLPLYFFMAWRLVKHRDNFTFTYPL
jgi:hypothetical protein